jgi:hypothetical protein
MQRPQAVELLGDPVQAPRKAGGLVQAAARGAHLGVAGEDARHAFERKRGVVLQPGGHLQQQAGQVDGRLSGASRPGRGGLG